MAKKDKKKNPVPTRKKLVGLQREQYYNRILLIATIVILAVVIGLVGWGYAYERFILPNRTVAVVEGHEIKGSEFKLYAQINRQSLIDNFRQLLNTYQFFASSPEISQQILNQMYQIQLQLDPLASGQATINQMVENELLRLEAQELGIEISDEEIEAGVQELFGFYPEGRPTATATWEPMPTSTLSETQLALVSATPTATMTSTPTASSTPAADATPTEASEAEDQEEAGPTATLPPPATAFPTPTPLTFEGYLEQYTTYLESQSETIGMTEQDLRNIAFYNILRERFRARVEADVDRMQDQVWARHILVPDLETADEVLQQLEDGMDWNLAAETYSIDTSNNLQGGDLGWFTFGTMVEEFSVVAFSLDIGEISGPAPTQFGVHIIQVLGHEERPVDAQTYQTLVEVEYQAFLNVLRNKYDYEIFEVWQDIAPDEPDLAPGERLSTQ